MSKLRILALAILTVGLTATYGIAGTIVGNTCQCATGSVCSFTYPTGQAVTVTAKPQTGYKFARWKGDVCDGAKGNPCTFTMPSTDIVTLNAVFIKDPQWRYTLVQSYGANPNDFFYGWSLTARQYMAWPFKVTSTFTLARVGILLQYYTGAVLTSPLHCYVYTDNAGKPGTSLVEANNALQDKLTFDWIEYFYDFKLILPPGTYWLVTKTEVVDPLNYGKWGALLSGSMSLMISPDGINWTLLYANQEGSFNLYTR